MLTRFITFSYMKEQTIASKPYHLIEPSFAHQHEGSLATTLVGQAWKIKHSEGTCYLYVRDDSKNVSGLPCAISIYIRGGILIYAVIMAIYHGYGTVVASRESHIGRTMWVMPWLLLNSFVMITMLICASAYSFGLYVSCSKPSSIAAHTDRCSMKNSSYRTMFTAEVCSWLSVLLWCGLIALEYIRMRRNRRARAREVYVDPDPNASDLTQIGDVTPTA